jgi:polysaccharide biosynthesis/export protein
LLLRSISMSERLTPPGNVSHRRGWGKRGTLALLVAVFCPLPATPQARPPALDSPAAREETSGDYNRQLQKLAQAMAGASQNAGAGDYRIGPEDLIEISVFEAPDLNRTVRVSADGKISLPMLGPVSAQGLTPRELELVLQELLRRTIMKDPHVAVSVQEMQSHPVSVFGAVKKPGVFQIRGAKSVVEILSMAQGLADDAGDTVIVVRHAGLAEQENSSSDRSEPIPATEREGRPREAIPQADEASSPQTLNIDLKNLLESGDPRYDVLVYPGDIVKVTRAGVVYVVGEVRKPGGFMLKTNEDISVLQALALAEGLTHTSAKSRVKVIHTDEATGKRSEVPINLDKILAGKAADPLLHPRDIVFVPNSASKSALYQGAQSALATATGVIIYRW